METILVSLDRGMFVDVHPRLTLSLKHWAEPRQNDKFEKMMKFRNFLLLKGDTTNQLRWNLAC